MYVAKEKNRCSECKKKVLYAGPKSARNILTDLSPNPARARTETSPDLKSPAYNSTQLYTKGILLLCSTK